MSATAFSQARALYEKGRLKAAVPYFQRALQEAPEDPNVIYHTILTLVSMRDYQGCANWLRELLPHIDARETQPWLMGGFHYNYGVANEASGHWADAITNYEKALEFDPSNHLAKIMLAGNAYRLGDPAKGERLDREVMAVPDLPTEPKASCALVKLLFGDYPGGFQDYEHRWKLPQILSQAYIPHGAKRWTGQHLEHGKRVLVVAEQGVGDVLMAARYIPLLAQMGVRPVLVVHGGLTRLLTESFPACDVHAIGAKHPGAGWWVPMLSLPTIFETTLATIPEAECLQAPVDGIQLPAPLSHPFRVGYVQRGNALHMGDKDRSCHDGGAWKVLLDTPNVEFVHLDEAYLKDRYGIRDMADTASIVGQCDLVISIDSAVAHLAGALGKPVWLLPPAAPEWRWGLGDTAPWYPRTHTLYRRRHVDAWSEVITHIRNDLERR